MVFLRSFLALISASGIILADSTTLNPVTLDENDRFGHSLDSNTTFLVAGAPGESSDTGINGNKDDNSLTESGAVFVYRRVNEMWVEEAFLKASDRTDFARFGAAVAISDDTIAIGAPIQPFFIDENDFFGTPAGAVYVFRRSGSTWIEEAILRPDNLGADDNFGFSVDIDGDTIIVGARFEASSADGVGGNASLDDAVDSGAAYIFTRTGSTWQQQAYLKAFDSDAFDEFGTSVSIEGDTAAVGSPFEDGASQGIGGDGTSNTADNSGAVYIFRRSGSTWSPASYIKSSESISGDFFGAAISLSLPRLAVGARGEDTSASSSGSAYIFKVTDTSWTETDIVRPSLAQADQEFGSSIDLSSRRLIVGAPRQQSLTGFSEVFVRSEESWNFASRLLASPPSGGDETGFAVTLSEQVAITGIPGDNDRAANAGLIFTSCLATATFSEWLAANNLSGAPGDDPDGDGLSHLLTYAYGLQPGSAGFSPDGVNVLPQINADGSQVSTLLPDQTPADLRYFWETGSDLGAWPNREPITDPSGAQTYHFSRTGPRHFARLLIEQTD